MSGSAETIASGYARERAAREGLTVVEPNHDELFVDIDSDADMSVFEVNVKLFSEHVIAVEKWSVTRSRSGHPQKRHIVVTLNSSIGSRERLFYQALLGSDRKRELLGLVRVNADDPTPTLFFEKNS